MQVLLNCSTLIKGGALQAAVAFIGSSLKQMDHIRWNFVVSRNVLEALQESGHMPRSQSIAVLEESPARSHRSRKMLQVLAKEGHADLVFTFFGPAYVDFDIPHLCGVADGWVTHGDRWAWRTVRSPIDATKLLGTILYKAAMFKKADAWVTESETAKNGLAKRLRIPESNIAVVPNNCAEHYLRCETIAEMPSSHDTVRILCLSAYYRHKNLEIIPAVAKELQRLLPNRHIEFVVTLPVDSDDLKRILIKAAALGVTDRIVNVGPVPISRGPEVYRTCHMLFLPSVLETFSANYPEAMAMGMPIITTDLSFARDACGDAACYFEPMNPRDAAGTISHLCGDETLWMSCVQKGKRVLQSLPTQQMKYELYRNCIDDLHRRHRAEPETSCR